jgi:dihydrofolate synthase/folylpolyglutamate synthase
LSSLLCEIKKIADILFPLAKEIILTRFPYFRAALPEEMKKQAQRFQDRIVLEPDIRRAIDKAIRSAGSRGCVLAAGSLYLVGELKKKRMFPGSQP